MFLCQCNYAGRVYITASIALVRSLGLTDVLRCKGVAPSGPGEPNFEKGLDSEAFFISGGNPETLSLVQASRRPQAWIQPELWQYKRSA